MQKDFWKYKINPCSIYFATSPVLYICLYIQVMLRLTYNVLKIRNNGKILTEDETTQEEGYIYHSDFSSYIYYYCYTNYFIYNTCTCTKSFSLFLVHVAFDFCHIFVFYIEISRSREIKSLNSFLVYNNIFQLSFNNITF